MKPRAFYTSRTTYPCGQKLDPISAGMGYILSLLQNKNDH